MHEINISVQRESTSFSLSRHNNCCIRDDTLNKSFFDTSDFCYHKLPATEEESDAKLTVVTNQLLVDPSSVLAMVVEGDAVFRDVISPLNHPLNSVSNMVGERSANIKDARRLLAVKRCFVLQ